MVLMLSFFLLLVCALSNKKNTHTQTTRHNQNITNIYAKTTITPLFIQPKNTVTTLNLPRNLMNTSYTRSTQHAKSLVNKHQTKTTKLHQSPSHHLSSLKENQKNCPPKHYQPKLWVRTRTVLASEHRAWAFKKPTKPQESRPNTNWKSDDKQQANKSLVKLCTTPQKPTANRLAPSTNMNGLSPQTTNMRKIDPQHLLKNPTKKNTKKNIKNSKTTRLPPPTPFFNPPFRPKHLGLPSAPINPSRLQQELQWQRTFGVDEEDATSENLQNFSEEMVKMSSRKWQGGKKEVLPLKEIL